MEPTTTALSAAEVGNIASSSSLPPTTTGTTPEYVARFNQLTARIFAREPLTVILRLEADRPADGIIRESHVHAGCGIRIKTKLANGGVIIEAANWSAAAIWDPPQDNATVAPMLTGAEAERRPIFVNFMRQIQEARDRVMGKGARYWHLSMMIRDPEKQHVKGAVRAVIEPYLARSRQEGLPIWIEAGSARARDVYGWMGFELMGEMWSGKGEFGADGYPAKDGKGEGVPTWFMIYNRQPRIEQELTNGA